MGACVSGHTQITDVNRIETKITQNSEHVAVIESSLMRRSEDRVNQYKIIDCIGSGFQSKVFRVENTKIRKTRHANTKRMYAMKMLKVEKIEKIAKKDSSVVSPKGSRKRGFTWIEVQVGKIISHDNVVKLHEVISSHKTMETFLIYEMCDGGIILNRKLNQPYPRTKLSNAIADSARGLAYLHSIGILHRDIKVENLLLTSSGVVKICDLGMAKILSRKKDEQLEDTLYKPIGSRHYRSPEMYLDESFSGFAADVWALGCVFFCLVTGELPFPYVKGGSRKKHVRKICNARVPSSKLLAGDLKKLIHGMLKKQPGRLGLRDVRSWVDERRGSRRYD